MLNRSASWAFALLLAGAPGLSPFVQAPSSAPTSILGVWRGSLGNLPAVEITLTDEGGELSGAVLFYLHLRKSPKEATAVTPGLAEPLFHLRFDGKTLAFQVSHRRAHPPGSLHDSPAGFHLIMTGPNQAELVNDAENQHLSLVRSEY